MDRRTPAAVEPLTAFEWEPWGAIEIKGVGPLETWILGDRHTSSVGAGRSQADDYAFCSWIAHAAFWVLMASAVSRRMAGFGAKGPSSRGSRMSALRPFTAIPLSRSGYLVLK